MMKVLRFTAIALLLVILAGFIYQWERSSQDLADYPPRGTLHEVNGVQMHIDCRGSGSPTILLEAGLTSGSTSWVRVHDKIAKHTQICAYDRPGMDYSAPLDTALSAQDISERLHNLLQAAQITGPTILVGMSAGGVFVREYFLHHPDDIVGMIFVDSSHEQQGDRLPPVTLPPMNLLKVCALVQPSGIVRVTGALDQIFDAYDLTDSETAPMSAVLNQSHTCQAMLLESDGFMAEIYDPQPPHSLGDLPLIVLSQGKAIEDRDDLDMSVEQQKALAQTWGELQIELANLSSRGERRIAHNSGHLIHFEQPQIVIDAAIDMLEMTRIAK